MSSTFDLPAIFDLLDDLLPSEDDLEDKGYRSGTASVVDAIEKCLKPSADPQKVIDTHMRKVAQRVMDVFENAEDGASADHVMADVFSAIGLLEAYGLKLSPSSNC